MNTIINLKPPNLMDTSFITKMHLSEQWLVFKQMLDEKRYEETANMVAQGYTVTAALLEILYRLDREDIIDRICRLPFKYDETAQAFLCSYYGDDVIEKILERIKRQNQKAQDAIAQAKEEERKEQLESMFALGFSQKVLEYAEKHDEWKAVIYRFGESVVYQGIMSNQQKYQYVRKYFSSDFLFSQGDFSDAMRLYKVSGYSDDFLAKLAKYSKGPEAIYNLHWCAANRWLIENGHKDLFYAGGSVGFLRLAKENKANDDDWRAWYAIDKNAALSLADCTSNAHAMMLLKQRGWLFLHGYIWKALIC